MRRLYSGRTRRTLALRKHYAALALRKHYAALALRKHYAALALRKHYAALALRKHYALIFLTCLRTHRYLFLSNNGQVPRNYTRNQCPTFSAAR